MAFAFGGSKAKMYVIFFIVSIVLKSLFTFITSSLQEKVFSYENIGITGLLFYFIVNSINCQAAVCPVFFMEEGSESSTVSRVVMCPISLSAEI